MRTIQKMHVFKESCKLYKQIALNGIRLLSHLPKDHCYRKLYPWKNLEDFTDHLHSNIVYNKDGLIAVNKPYGIKSYKQNNKETKHVNQTVVFSSQEEFRYTLEDTLPGLKQRLNVSNLFIVKCAERYMSGIVILSSNNKTTDRVKKSMKSAMPKKIPHLVHWALTKGYPIVPTTKEKVGLQLVYIDFKDQKQPVILKNFSKKSVERNEVRPILVEYRTLGINKEVSSSLLEIASSSVKSHFLRIYSASKTSCILGDTMYGSRVKKVLGRPIQISPHNAAAYDVEPLPDIMCRKLSLPCGLKGHLKMPTMLHFYSIILPDFLSGEDLIIKAPPPPHFIWTCSQLNVSPEIMLMLNNKTV